MWMRATLRKEPAFRKGDVIVELDGQPVTGSDDLAEKLSYYAAGGDGRNGHCKGCQRRIRGADNGSDAGCKTLFRILIQNFYKNFSLQAQRL